MADQELKVLATRLRSYKGWLTQCLRGCSNVLKMPRSVASASFLKSRITQAIADLDGRFHRIEVCLQDLEECETANEYNDDRKRREETYIATRTECTDKYEAALNELASALAGLDTAAEPEMASNPGDMANTHRGGGDTAAAHWRVQDTLKPFLLTKDHTPREFLRWGREFRAFYSASRLGQLDVIGQQAFFRRFVEAGLLSVLETSISASTPIFDDPNQPGTASCFSLLEEEYRQRYPVVSRRVAFFGLSQVKDQGFMEFLAQVKLFGTLADIETLDVEHLYVFKAVVGMHDDFSDL